jgi:hypothetical protein
MASGLSPPPHGEEIIFQRETDCICCGFPYLDMRSTAAVAMVQTMRQHYKGFTKREVLNATEVRKAQAMTRHPSNAQFNEMVRNKTIKNCPIKPKHIANLHAISGLSIARVHRKAILHRPEQVEVESGCISDDFHQLHQFVVLIGGQPIKLSKKLPQTSVLELDHVCICHMTSHVSLVEKFHPQPKLWGKLLQFSVFD